MQYAKKRQETREKLFQAFFSEYKNKPIQNITIDSITKIAQVNRSTFYYHFLDIYDLLDQAKAELLDMLEFYANQIESTLYEENFERLKEFAQTVLPKYGDRIALLLINDDSGFRPQLENALLQQYVKLLSIDAEDFYCHLTLSYILSGLTGYIIELYQSEHNFYEPDIFDHLHHMMVSSINVYLEKQGNPGKTLQYR